MTAAQKAAELAKQLAALLGQTDAPANDEEPAIDEEAIRAMAKRDAELMRRARRR